MEDLQKIKNDLENLEKEVETAKRETSEMEGEKKQLYKNLNEQLGLKNLKETQEKIEENNKTLEILMDKIQRLYQELKESYSW